MSTHSRVYLALSIEVALVGAAFALELFDPSGWGAGTKLLIIFAVVVTSTTLAYFEIAKPFMANRHSYAANVMDVLVDGFLAQHSEIHFGDPPTLRFNLMLMTRDRWSWRKKLKISYHYQPDEQSLYSQPELALGFEVGQGNCGRAFERRDLRFFERDQDPQKQREQEEHYRLTPEQAHILDDAGVGSVLSIPVFHPEDRNQSSPIGVLNIDCPDSLEQSLFDQPSVQNLAIRLSGAAGILFH